MRKEIPIHWLVAEERAYVSGLTAGQREGRLLGKELDAALEDPRWKAVERLKSKGETNG